MMLLSLHGFVLFVRCVERVSTRKSESHNKIKILHVSYLAYDG